MSKIYNSKKLKPFRKNLRKNLTPTESRLWVELKNSKLSDRRFRRQESIGKYIVDFYCPSEKLVIELDGANHFTSIGNLYDIKGDAYLTGLGLRVLHFENKSIWENLDYVLDCIQDAFT